MALGHPVARIVEREGRRPAASSRATTATTRLPHSASGRPTTSAARDRGVLAEAGRDRGGRYVHPAADDHVVDPAEHAEPTVLVEPPRVGGEEPAVHERRAGRRLVVEVAVEEGRAGEPDPAVGGQREADAVERQPVVHAAAAGLGRAVRRDHPHPGLGRARAQRGVDRTSADEHRVRNRPSAARSAGTSSHRWSWVGTTDRKPPGRRHVGQACGRRGPPGRCPATSERTTTLNPATYDDGSASTHGPEPPSAGGRGSGGGEHRVAGEDDLLRRARGARGREHDRARASAADSHASTASTSRSASPVSRREVMRRTLVARITPSRATARPRLLESGHGHRRSLGRRRPPAHAARPPSRRCWPAPAVALYVDGAVWWKALLALVVSLALQVGVNYANDYSDGIRGTDADRVGPMRLVGSGTASPGAGEARGVRWRSGWPPSPAWCSPRPPPGGWSRSARSASWPPGSTPAARSPTATSGSAR